MIDDPQSLLESVADSQLAKQERLSQLKAIAALSLPSLNRACPQL
jgi:hypothetical protein